jgi:signal peptidase II
MLPKARVFWPMLLIVALADCTTKDLAVEHLEGSYLPREVIGSLVRFTLSYNPGIAFGIDPEPYLGALTRPVLIMVALGIAAFLFRVYWRARPTARLLSAGIALALGGAIGNALDRVRGRPGVVDWIDVGMQSHRFYVMNVADIAVSVGACLLLLTMWREPDDIMADTAPRS